MAQMQAVAKQSVKDLRNSLIGLSKVEKSPPIVL
jgi:hypothetical protein